MSVAVAVVEVSVVSEIACKHGADRQYGYMRIVRAASTPHSSSLTAAPPHNAAAQSSGTLLP